jgi:hypothetical protein
MNNQELSVLEALLEASPYEIQTASKLEDYVSQQLSGMYLFI